MFSNLIVFVFYYEVVDGKLLLKVVMCVDGY